MSTWIPRWQPHDQEVKEKHEKRTTQTRIHATSYIFPILYV